MDLALNALSPIIALILLGSILKRSNFFDVGLWAGLERLSYFVLTPVLLVFVISNKSLDNMPWPEIALSVDITVICIAALFWLVKLMAPRLGAARFTSLFQGGVRFNTFVGLALAQNLYGDEGVIIAALGAGFMIALINLLCVTTFSIALKKEGNIFKTVGLQVIKNPLIIGCAVGWSINIAGWQIPVAINNGLEILGRAALPIALLSVGAALRFRALGEYKRHSLFVGCVQFAIKPALTTVLCVYFGLPPMMTVVLALCLATPTAPSSYILARQLGGDHDLMAAMITQQTLVAFLTIPLTIWILGQTIGL